VESTYAKVNDTTLKISTVVEQEVTHAQLTEEQQRLTSELGSLEKQYAEHKAILLAHLSAADKAIAQAEKFKLEATDVKEPEQLPTKEEPIDPLTPIEGEVIGG